jgi:hypothetical protein
MLLPATAVAIMQAPSGCRAVAGASVRSISVGECVRSVIDASDPKNPDEIPYEDWRLTLRQGEEVQIDLDAISQAAAASPSSAGSSSAVPEDAGFDTYLELRRPGVEEPVTVNDDREGSLNSTIIFTAPAAGEYIVRARPLYGDGGPYTLRVAPPPPPPVATPLAAGTNALAPVEPGGSAVQPRLFTFDGVAGERVRISLPGSARGSGTQMRLIRPGGDVIAADGGFSERAELTSILPSTGTYQVLVQLQNGGSASPPQILQFDRRPAVPARAPTRVRVGQTVERELGFDSPAMADPYDSGGFILNELFALRLRAGQTVTVLLESSAFDPLLEAGGMSVLGFGAALSNDDSDGLNSRLVLRPERSGTVVLRARALGAGTGPFRLRIVAGEAPPPAE